MSRAYCVLLALLWIVAAARAQFVDLIENSTWTPSTPLGTSDIPLTTSGDLNGDGVPEVVILYYSPACLDVVVPGDAFLLIWWSSSQSTYVVRGYFPGKIFLEYGPVLASYYDRWPAVAMIAVPSRIATLGRLYVFDGSYVRAFQADPKTLQLSASASDTFFQGALAAKSRVPIAVDARKSGYPVVLIPGGATEYFAYEELENTTIVDAKAMFPFPSFPSASYFGANNAVADVNGDTYEDILLVSNFAAPVFLVNAQNGSFLLSIAPSPFSSSFSLSSNLRAIVAMDWNHDGYADISLIGIVPSNGSLQLTNLRNLTFQSFVPASIPFLRKNIRATAFNITKISLPTLNLVVFGTAENGTSSLLMFRVYSNGSLFDLQQFGSYSTLAKIRLARSLIPLPNMPTALYDSILVFGPEITNGINVSAVQYLSIPSDSFFSLSVDSFGSAQVTTDQFDPSGSQRKPVRHTSGAASDFNGDGCLDIFLQGVIESDPYNHLFYGQCNGLFTESSISFNNGHGLRDGSVLALDLDLDGYPELYFNGAIIFSNGTITLYSQLYSFDRSGNPYYHDSTLAALYRSSIVAFRLDDDALPDIAMMGTSSATTGGAFFYQNLGRLNFSELTAVGYSPALFQGPSAGGIVSLPSGSVLGVDNLLFVGQNYNSTSLDTVLFFSNRGNGTLLLNSTVSVFGFSLQLVFPALAAGRSATGETLVFMSGIGSLGALSGFVFVYHSGNGTFTNSSLHPPTIATSNGAALFVDLDMDALEELVIIGRAGSVNIFAVYQQNSTAFVDVSDWYFGSLGGSYRFGASASPSTVAQIIAGNFVSNDANPRPSMFVSSFVTNDCSMHFLAQISLSPNDTSTSTSSSSSSSDDTLIGIIAGSIAGVGVVGLAFLCCTCLLCACCIVSLAVGCGAALVLILVVLVVAVASAGGFIAADSAIIAVVLRHRKEASGPDSSSGPNLSSIDMAALIARAAETETYNVIAWGELRVLRKLGSGAFGEVLLAEWGGVEVAVKTFRDPSPEAVSDFEHEALMMSKVSHHPNMVNLIGVSVHGSSVSLVMGLCTGGSLLGALEAGRLDVRTKTRLLGETAGALAFLHTLGIVHRDVAARNVLLDSGGSARLADLGMSRVLARGADSQQTSTAIGPVRWMAPECIERRQYSAASDAYAFAMLMVEVWSDGRPPFVDIKGLADVAIRVVREDARPAPPDATPLAQERLMRRMWAREPSQRPSLAEACEVFSIAVAPPPADAPVMTSNYGVIYENS